MKYVPEIGLSRRSLLKFGIGASVGVGSGVVQNAFSSGGNQSAETTDDLTYILSDEGTGLCIELKTKNIIERTGGRRRYLFPDGSGSPSLLIFEFPPQHYLESALKLDINFPGVISDKDLKAIKVLPSGKSRLVFKVIWKNLHRSSRKQRIELSLRSLLDWSRFQLVTPGFGDDADKYDLYLESSEPNTRIEMPWGMELQPLGSSVENPTAEDLLVKVKDGDDEIYGLSQAYSWRTKLEFDSQSPWQELWTATLTNSYRITEPLEFEILSVKGFKRIEDDTRIKYQDLTGFYGDAKVTELHQKASITPTDRLELALSLSRRFMYTGQSTQPPTPAQVIEYQSAIFNQTGKNYYACKLPETSLSVSDYRLSSLGGWLSLDSQWAVSPPCALTGYTHRADMGRDNYVKLVRKGFLYPFGIEAFLVTLTERLFVPDDRGRYVAVLYKQQFIEVPQPNELVMNHRESVFTRLSITTEKTPPLDYCLFDGSEVNCEQVHYFVPKAGGIPIKFEHKGVDWNGESHYSSMPMIFVSNDAVSESGLIWEPGYSNWPAPDSPGAIKRGMIPKHGLGLSVVDKVWLEEEFRFARYGDKKLAVASSSSNGDTTHKVNWVEWVRGRHDVPRSGTLADRPFVTRSRTIKLALEGPGKFSGEASYHLATFRNIKTIVSPAMDPWPVAPADVYFENVPVQNTEDASTPYLFMLEHRSLKDVPKDPAPSSSLERTRALMPAYFGADPDDDAKRSSYEQLLSNLNNEITFGRKKSSESTGGLAVPDTYVSNVNREVGPIGDASWNEAGWTGFNGDTKKRLKELLRIDHLGFSAAQRWDGNLKVYKIYDVESMDGFTAYPETAAKHMEYVKTKEEDGTPLPENEVTKQIAAYLGAKRLSLVENPTSGLRIAELFGLDAEIIPGIRFSDVFKEVFLDNGSGLEPFIEEYKEEKKSLQNQQPNNSQNKVLVQEPGRAPPLRWDFRVTGIDWLLAMIGDGPSQFTLDEFISLISSRPETSELLEPAKLGIEASLSWQTRNIDPDSKIGPILFNPSEPVTSKLPEIGFSLDAGLSVSSNIDALPTSLSGLDLKIEDPRIHATARLENFQVQIFEAIEVAFGHVEFALTPNGDKKFNTDVKDVGFTGPLQFIEEMAQVLQGLGNDNGISIRIKPSEVKITQSLAFPPEPNQPLFIGPAQISNLVLGWGLRIPLRGRDVLSLHFALASRAKPLTIYVPPWYGGKAHVYLEVTTKGVRMLEVSMQYGALIPITWGPAKGEASVTAGIFYSVKKLDSEKGGEVILRAFVKASANLSVAGIIHFNGMILVMLSYINETLLRGETTVTVSIKIGFVRYSYSFTAVREERTGNGVLEDRVKLLGGQNFDPKAYNDKPFEQVNRELWNQFIDGYAA
ncbi:MAG: hypothetical protein JJ956_14180 [Pseudomonadales bacterium]|nr:hypothetical protein [Pseudomonadales bacterium]